MITFEEACDIALRHYEDALGISGIHSPCDIGDAWVFNGGQEDEKRIGIQKISVSKDDGSVYTFNLPSDRNFATLESAIPMKR